MREIKFRAWDKERFCMSKIFGLSEHPKFIINGCVTASSIKAVSSHFSSEPKIFTSTERFELMQYTGLKDKNGVEIYEGDIINITGANRQVIFINGAFGFDDGDFFYEYACNLASATYGEVIGNIYENKELL